jgi:hypothetical protein
MWDELKSRSWLKIGAKETGEENKTEVNQN